MDAPNDRQAWSAIMGGFSLTIFACNCKDIQFAIEIRVWHAVLKWVYFDIVDLPNEFDLNVRVLAVFVGRLMSHTT